MVPAARHRGGNIGPPFCTATPQGGNAAAGSRRVNCGGSPFDGHEWVVSVALRKYGGVGPRQQKRGDKMPLKHICCYPGCNRLVDVSRLYCDKHVGCRSERQSEYDHSVRLKRDAQLHQFYDSPEWEYTARFVNSRFKGLCLWSYYHGSIAPAEAVHHIIPLRKAWERRLDVGNLIPLTHANHMMVEAEYRHGNAEVMQQGLFSLLERWKHDFNPRGG